MEIWIYNAREEIPPYRAAANLIDLTVTGESPSEFTQLSLCLFSCLYYCIFALLFS